MTAQKEAKKVYICCRYCMQINPKLLIPCAKHREGTDFNLHACPKKERNEINSETLKPQWEEISEAEFMEIYELSKMLKANTDIIFLQNNKLYGKWTKRVQNNNSKS